MALGNCNCGAVAFELNVELSDVYVCHCSLCRRATGSSGIAVVVVANKSFCWTQGEAQVVTWEKPGTDWQTWFCRDCGSPLPGVNDDQRMFVPAGLLTEGDAELKVRHHIWVGSKADWDEIGGSGRQHGEAFEG